MGIFRIQTPEGEVPVIEPILRRLAMGGYIARDPVTGRFTGASFEGVQEAIKLLGVCDFCDAEDPPHVIPTPTFDLPLTDGGVVTDGSGGWAACDECNTLIQEDKRAELLARSIQRAGVGKYGAASIQAVQEAFWKAHDDLVYATGGLRALNDYIEDKLPDMTVKIQLRDHRIAVLKKLIGLNDDDVRALENGVETGSLVRKFSGWMKKVGGDYKDARRLIEAFQYIDSPPLPPGRIPHWQRALDMRFSALKEMKVLQDVAKDEPYVTPKSTDLGNQDMVLEMIRRAQAHQVIKEMQFEADLDLLRRAETYSFNEETISAIIEAAKSIPHESPLSSVDVPRAGAGWFWFTTPLDVASSPISSQHTHALLWGWSEQAQVGEAVFTDGKLEGFTPTRPNVKPTVMLRFSAYVIDESDQSTLHGRVLPSTKWYWPLEMSFHDMLGFNAAEYRRAYGPGAPWEHERGVTGEAATLEVIGKLSLFFMMACLWFKQEVPGRSILTQEPGHVERHARKRYQREHKLKEAPTVRVIALRKTHRDVKPPEPREGEERTPREYDHRWIVRGHARLQPCGPGRSERKLIWISPFIKGPDDKPLRTSDKVFAVIR